MVSGGNGPLGALPAGPFRFVAPPSLPIGQVSLPSPRESGAVQPLTVPVTAPSTTRSSVTTTEQATTQTQAKTQAKSCPFGH